MKYNVAFGVLGSSAKLSERDQGSTGQSDYYKTLYWLVREKNIKNVLLFSYRDLKKEPEILKELDPEGKIKSVFDLGYKYPGFALESAKTLEDLQKIIDCASILSPERLGDLFPDFGIFFTSQGSMTSSVYPGYLDTIRYERKAKVLVMAANYASPIFAWLSLYKTPWVMLATDPRYLKRTLYPREVTNPPLSILSQFNQEHVWKRMQTFDPKNLQIPGEVVEEKWFSKYEGIEKIDLIGVSLDPKVFENKKIRFSIISKQVESDGTPIEKDFRYKELNEWIVLPDPDATSSIYGYWHESRHQGRPHFKGYIKSTEDLYKILQETKYTLVLPTRDGWATSKPWIVASNGTIPFIHPKYDIQGNQKIPEFLRVKTPDEMYSKMNLLDKDDSFRIRLLEQLFQEMSDGPDGSFMKKILNKKFEEKGIEYKL